MISKILCLFLILVICSDVVYSQWKAGASYNTKRDVPGNGFGVNIGRNMPFQWPLIGFMIRAGANLFTTNNELSDEENPPVRQLTQTNIHLNLLGTFYPRYVYPYAGIGFGFGSLSFETRDSGTDEFLYTGSTKNYFFIEGLTGIRLSVIKNFYPFVEVRLVKYLTSFRNINSDISSLQYGWYLGLEIGFDTI